MPPPPNAPKQPDLPAPITPIKTPTLFANPNHFQNLATAVKNTAIFSKRLITEISDSPATIPHVCQQAEQAAFLVALAVVEFEMKFSKRLEGEKEGEEAKKRVVLLAKTAEELHKSVLDGTKLASQLVGLGKEEEEEHINFQRMQLMVSEKVNLMLDLISTIHQSDLAINQEDAIKAPVQTEMEAKGFDMADVRQRKGLQFIFSLAKRISEMISKLPHEQATLPPQEILKNAIDRERCISLLVNLARKYARSRCDSSSQQVILDAASRTKASSTALLSSQKEVLSSKSNSKQSDFTARAKDFSYELVCLLGCLTSVRGSGEGKQKELNIWEEDKQLGKNIIMENAGNANKKQIKAATLNQMINYITENSDVPFRKAFIATFQSFVSPEELFKKLVQRYNVPRKKFKNLEASEFKAKVAMIQKIIITNIFYKWIEDRPTDFNYGMVKKLNDFVDGSLRSDGYNDEAEKILTKIRNQMEKQHQNNEIERILKPGIKVNQTLMDCDEIELAKQFTLHEYWVYKKIQPVELLNLAWSSAKLRHRAPNVMKMIERANNISAWMTHILLSEKGLKMRAKYFAKFVRMGQACYDQGNYNTLLAILACVNSAALKRLKFTKEEAGSKVKGMLEDLTKKMSPDMSYKSIREILHSRAPPALPYLGVFLTDLTFIEEGNQDKIGGLINFKKRFYVYNVLTEIQTYQHVDYSYPVNETIQMCLENLDFKELDSKSQFAKSLELENRGAQKHELVQ